MITVFSTYLQAEGSSFYFQTNSKTIISSATHCCLIKETQFITQNLIQYSKKKTIQFAPSKKVFDQQPFRPLTNRTRFVTVHDHLSFFFFFPKAYQVRSFSLLRVHYDHTATEFQ